MRVRLLGPVELDVELSGKRERALVAMLALAAGTPVEASDVVQGLWGARAPEDPRASLAALVARVRAVVPELRMDGDRLILALARAEVDALVLEDELAAARHEQDAARASARLEAALDLRCGPALTGLLGVPFSTAAAERLEELWLDVVEEQAGLQLRLGRAGSLVARLRALVDAHPTRQQLWALLMTALYRDFRAEDAVAVYAEARERIAEELGIEPSEALQRLEAAILRNDPALGRGPEEATSAARPRAGARVPSLRSPTFGRDELCRDVRGHLDAAGQAVVTLTGLGGSGKTRVAVVVAREMQDAGSRVAWFSLGDGATSSPRVDDVAGGLEAEVGESGQVVLPPDQRALVVLDNCDDLDSGGADLLTLVEACPAVDFLVTSRVRLNLAIERAIAVPPLELPAPGTDLAAVAASPAVQLFVTTAERATQDFTLAEHVEEVTDVCRLLDGVPLALELAAARVQVPGLAGVLAGLRRNLDLLRTTAVDVPERQRALTTTIEWSLGRLTPAQRRVLVRLAVFDGGFTLESAEAICSDLTDVVDAVSGLMEAGLLRSAESRIEIRYAVPKTVRAHVRPDVESSPESVSIRERLAEHLAERLEGWARQLDGADGRLVQARFEDEMSDIEGSVDWLLTRGRIEQAVRLTLLSTPFWIDSGRLTDALARTQRVQQHVPAESVASGRLKSAAGRLAYQLTRWEIAAPELSDAIRIAESHGDEPTLAAARCYLGGTRVMTRDYNAGKALADLSLEAAERLQLYPLVVEALSLKALCHLYLSELKDEQATQERRLQLARAHHDDMRTADAYNTLAEIALDEVEPERAASYATACIELGAGRLPIERRDATITLARATAMLEDLDGAKEHLGRAIADSYRIGQTLAIAQSARVGGVLAFGYGEHDLAVRLFAAAETLAPSPRANGVPAESDFAAALENARAELGTTRAEDAWTLGSSMPLADLRRLLDAAVALS